MSASKYTYDPANIASEVSSTYMVKTAGDRLFIPVNSEDTMAAQTTQCLKVSPVGAEEVVS